MAEQGEGVDLLRRRLGDGDRRGPAVLGRAGERVEPRDVAGVPQKTLPHDSVADINPSP